MSKAKCKIRKVMREFKRGKLRSGSGKKVVSRKQAIRIALEEARRVAGSRVRIKKGRRGPIRNIGSLSMMEMEKHRRRRA